MSRVIISSRSKPYRRRAIAAIGVLLLSALAVGAAPPEFVGLRVPSEKVGTWFPAGTELRGMPIAEFRQLWDRAVAGSRRGEERMGPRLLRARHHARWDAGVLIGRSELTIDVPGSGPALFSLDPWTPAIDAPAPETSALRVTQTGQTSLWAEPGASREFRLDWQLRARARSKGRGFTLGLPRTESASLTLDLPAEWIPDGPPGIRQGPEPGSEPGRVVWRFDGKGGEINLQLHEPTSGPNAFRDEPIWVSGQTRVAVGEASANWTTDWMVNAGPRGARTFQVDLDPGLMFLSAGGPGVEDARVNAETPGGPTRITIWLNGAVAGPTPVSIRALARVPSEGLWSVPAARPVDAVWTGGRTVVRLDTTRALKDCRDEGGRRVAPRAGEVADGNLLVFESDSPRPVAVLTFGKPQADVSVDVRGRLLLSDSAPRLDCQLIWRVHRGRALALDFDLPPAWVPDRVQVAGVEEPLAWHPEVLPGGALRVRVTPPSGEFARNTLVMDVAATAAIAGGRGPLSLPRVRPVAARVADERWLARTAPGMSLRPTSAQGLAWIEPALVADSTVSFPDSPSDLRDALAWRWISDQAEARVDRDQAPSEPGGSIRLTATVDRTRIRLDWQISVLPGEQPLRSVLIGASNLPTDLNEWRYRDESTGLEIPRRRVAGRKPGELGLSGADEVWELVLPHSKSGRLAVQASLDLRSLGDVAVPLLALPASFRANNLVVIRVARDALATAEAAGLQVLDPDVAGELVGIRRRDVSGERSDLEFGGKRTDFAFGYSRPGGRLRLRTESLRPVRTRGVIDQAVLSTVVDPRGQDRHRLMLRVVSDGLESLDLVLPVAASLSRVRRDGQDIAPTRSERGVSIPLTIGPGPKTSNAIILEYLTPHHVDGGSPTLRPERPGASLPFLSLRWEVTVPRPWKIDQHGRELVAADPSAVERWFDVWASLGLHSQTAAAETSAGVHGSEMLRALDRRVTETRPDEVTLGDWFTRWDAGQWPLIIDRMALESAGWGPRSRVIPPRAESVRAGAAVAALQPLGLTLVPVGDAVLITTRVEAPDRAGGPWSQPKVRAAWETTVREVLASGRDLADRFQLVTRWRGEGTPKIRNGGEPAGLELPGEGWRTWRFAAVGWPGAGTELRLVDERRRAAVGWAVGLAVFAVGMALRRVSVYLRAAGLAAAFAAGLLGMLSGRVDTPYVGAAILIGAGATLCYWLGRSIPSAARRKDIDPRPSSPSTRRALGTGAATALLASVGFVAGGGPARVASAEAEAVTPFVVLYPYEGNPNLALAPERAILRLRDFDRLKELGGQEAEQRNRGVSAVTAVHRLAWRGERQLVVESEFDLVVAGDALSAWSIPIEGTRDITATLDAADTPVRIEPGSRNASVVITGEGRHRLKISRLASPARTESGAAVVLQVNSIASARVAVDSDSNGRRGEVIGARGRGQIEGNTTTTALGPVSRLEVRWNSDSATPERVALAGDVEGLILWDAEPSGDRIRARLTFRAQGGTSQVRLRLDSDAVLCTRNIPGIVDVSWEGTREHPEWVASIDPPLPSGTMIPLEFWRPKAGRATGEEAQIRPFPTIEPLGVERYFGAVGFRRPADWVGRLAAGAGDQAISEEAFVRAWGDLPEEPLTLSGATRFSHAPKFEPRVGPQPRKAAVSPVVQLELGPGRIDMDLKADVSEISGTTYQVEIDVPAALRIIRVDADGLTDWNRSPDRLRLRFDGAPARQRGIRVQGWVPVPVNPLAAGRSSHTIAIPWPRWIDAEMRGGTLNVGSASAFQLEPGAGMSALAQGPAGTRTGGAGTRLVYRVTQSDNVGRILWEIGPAQLSVQVRSQLTVHPETAEWVAALRYDVSGGACDAFHLKLPTAWAASADVKVIGDDFQITSETHGSSTFWTIRPERPVWGSRRLVVRSVRPCSSKETLVFPELSPLGHGAVDTYLAIANASGREMAVEGSPGLQPLVDHSRFQSDEFPAFPGLGVEVYRVKAEAWSLKLEPAAGGRGTGAPSIGQADFDCAVRPDGSTLGVARFETDARSGPFLKVALPVGTEPLWASVNGVPSRPMQAESGGWLIPLDRARSSEAMLIWRSLAPAFAELGVEQSVPLPAFEPAGVPTFVSVNAPGLARVEGVRQQFERVKAGRVELSRSEWLKRSITESLAKIDRGSLRDRESLVAALVAFELSLRQAERAITVGGGTESHSSPDEWADRLKRRTRELRSDVADAIAAAGLDEEARAARVHLGLEPEDPARPALQIPEPIVPVRIREIGRPHDFQGQSHGAAIKPVLRMLPGENLPNAAGGRAGAEQLPIVLVIPGLAWILTILAGRPGRMRVLPAVLVFVASMLFAGPYGVAAVLILLCAGRMSV